MRRLALIFSLLFTALIFVQAVGLAQEGQPQPEPTPLPQPTQPNEVVEHPNRMIDSAEPWQPSAEMVTLSNSTTPLTLMAEAPGDSCSEATNLILFPEISPGDGSVADVANYTIEDSDPPLSCAWGQPYRARGFRTAWFRYDALANGRVDLSTFNSTYDTVLQVYTGDAECGNLVPIACNDDADGFTSATSFEASAGQTYYIEVADWQAGIDESTELQFSAILEPSLNRWTTQATMPAPPAISRHAVVANPNGQNVYVIGGQTGESGLPIISNKLYAFNTVANTWTELADMPGSGYSNTTAVYMNGRIYVPMGDTGNPELYGETHWVYDINADRWFSQKGIPYTDTPFLKPFAWAQAVVRPGANQYFLVGGLSSTNPFEANLQVLDTVYLYSATTNTWSSLDDFRRMTSPRYAHTGVWLPGRGICVTGGLNSNETSSVLVTTAECYNPGGEWVQIAPMNIPRYMAHSVVGPDGNWYVFGGYRVVAGRSIPTAVTEVYDPATNTWSMLPPSYNLGGTLESPARVWPRGAVIRNKLYVIGGSTVTDGEQALPLVEEIFMPSTSSYLPVAWGNYSDFERPDDAMSTARPMAFGIPQSRNFDRQLDFYDFFTFNNVPEGQFTVTLEVPEGADFNISVYNDNKVLFGRSASPFQGEDEQIVLTGSQGKFYILVERAFPTGEPDPDQVYRLAVTR